MKTITRVEYYLHYSDKQLAEDINYLANEETNKGRKPLCIEGSKQALKYLMANQSINEYPKYFMSTNGPFELLQVDEKEEPNITVVFVPDKEEN